MTATRATGWNASSRSSTRRCWWCRRSSASGIFLTPARSPTSCRIRVSCSRPGSSAACCRSPARSRTPSSARCSRTPAATTSTCARRTIRWPASWSAGSRSSSSTPARSRRWRSASPTRLAHFVPLGRRGRARRSRSAITVATSTINYVGVRAGARVNNVHRRVKIVALVVLAVGGLARRPRQRRPPPRRSLAGASDVPARRLRPRALAGPVLLSRLERVGLRRAARSATPSAPCRARSSSGSASAPRSTSLVNVVYLYALPIDVLRAEPRAGEAAARALFGPLGGTLVALLVLASILELPERDHPGRPAHRLRDGARRPLLPRRASACTSRTARRTSRSSCRRAIAIALVAPAAALPERARLHDVRDRARDHGRHERALRAAPPPTASAAPLSRLGLPVRAGALPGRRTPASPSPCSGAVHSSAWRRSA